jgi:hypothetical protein
VLEYPVERFMSEVSGEPPLSGLRDIFARGEYEFPDLAREKPGFKARRQINAVVLTANFEDFLTNAESSVKPEEIQELYDRYVEEKNPLVMELVPEEPEAADPGDDPAPEFNLEGDEPIGQAAGADSPPAGGSGDDKSGDDKSGDDKSGDDKSGDDKSGDGGSPVARSNLAADELPRSGPSPGPDVKRPQQEQEKRKQEKQEQEQQKQQEQEQQKQEQQKQEQQKQEQSGETTEPPATESGAAVKSESAANTTPSGQSSDPVPVLEGPPEIPQDDLIGDLAVQPERRVKQLDEELSRLLKRELAREPASNAMNTAVVEAAGDIADYGSDLNAWKTTQDAPLDEREPKPDPIDLESIARQYKLQLQETGLTNYATLRETPVGQIGVTIQRIFYGRPFQDRLSLAEYLFGNYFQLDVWVPETVMEFGSNNQHIILFTEKVDTRVRTFDEARDDVVEFWRYEQALEKAREAASGVADEVNSSGEMLTDKFPADARPLGEFTYHTSGQIYPELDNSVRTGPEFMRTAFGLEINQAGVAADATRDHVYVIQVTAVDPRSDEELQELFFTEMAANSTRGGMSDGINRLYEVDTQEFINKYFADIEKELDIKWLAH